MPKSRVKPLLICSGILGVVLIGVIIVSINRQSIQDWLALINYKPSEQISSIATQDGMKSYTRTVFYVNHPHIDTRTAFSKVCPSNSEQTVVLGCYHSGQQGIFILSVTNPQLYGIEQVTAAYETLHAIYQRLNAHDQAQLNSELFSFENNGLTSVVVKSQIANFKKSEPGGVLNEMTSLFGTEVPNLPPALTSFYAKYFNNRQILLNFYNQYSSAFTLREQQITAYDSQLAGLHSTLSTDEAELATDLSIINGEKATLNSDSSSGNNVAYNAALPAYNQLVNEYNSLAQTVSLVVTQYNQIVAERNSIALEEQHLAQSITGATPKALNN